MVDLIISCIRLDGGTQPRSALSDVVIAEYAEAMKHGARFDPVDVFDDGRFYWLADGFHRIRAASSAGFGTIPATVHEGTLAAAQWFSYGANQKYGLQRSHYDKSRAVRAALKHQNSSGLSDSQIAKHVGVCGKTVASWRARLFGSTGDGMRTAIRYGRPYRISVRRIGKRATPPAGWRALPKPGTKRRAMLEHAAKDRFSRLVSVSLCACEGLAFVNVQLALAASTEDEIASYTRSAAKSIKQLRTMLRALRGAGGAKA